MPTDTEMDNSNVSTCAVDTLFRDTPNVQYSHLTNTRINIPGDSPVPLHPCVSHFKHEVTAELDESEIDAIITNKEMLKRKTLHKNQHRIYSHIHQDVNEQLDERLDKIVEKFYEVDSPQTLAMDQESLSQDELKAQNIWENTCQFINGNYECEISFKTPNPKMPNSVPATMRRLRLLEKKLRHNPSLLEEYRPKMQKLLDDGHAEPASKLPTMWTLPHFPSFHDYKAMRIVFDCAASINGVSLNSMALPGPNQANMLLEVFLRWRQRKYRWMGDVRAMFYNCVVPKKQRPYLRYFWFENGDLDGEIKEYQLTVHLFGGTWSPGVALFCLKKAAMEQVDKFGPDVIDAICRQFYIDDFLNSMDDFNQSAMNIRGVRECLSNRGFTLTKFIANDKELLATVPEEHRAKEVQGLNLDLDSEQLPVDRALGTMWNAQTDELCMTRKRKEKPETKRGILSYIASTYDVSGMIAPVILGGKLVFQDVCRQKFDWDQEIDPVNLEKWRKWLQEIPEIEKFKIPVGYVPKNFVKMAEIQLHNFADGSSSSFGSVHYLRAVDESGNIAVGFILARTRLKPIQCKDNLTIPKTELCAAVQAAQLAKKIELYLDFQFTQRFFWTDSMITLCYINMDPSKKPRVFIANRLGEILNLSDKEEWNFINGEINPADHCSRGRTATEFLKLENWAGDRDVTGPAFLRLPESEWPTNRKLPVYEQIPDNNDFINENKSKKKAVSKKAVCKPVTYPRTRDGYVTTKILTHFSTDENQKPAIHAGTWTKVKRRVAWLQKVFKKLRERVKKRKENPYNLRPRKKREEKEKEEEGEEKGIPKLSTDDLAEAERVIIRNIQRLEYEPYVILNNGRIGLPKSHDLFCWGPYVDETDELLKVKSRVKTLGYRPIIIPDKSVVTDMIILHYHNRYSHGGREFTISIINSNGYWIRSPRPAVKTLLKNCIVCQRLNAKGESQLMKDLPLDRVAIGKPAFYVTGIDAFGHYWIQVGTRTRRWEKRWVLAFTCASSRNCHFEMLYRMDCDSFLLAMSKFCNHHTFPHTCRSDNGTNFTAGCKEINDSLREFHRSEKVQNNLASLGIKWIFNTPAASHHGGFVERVVGIARRCLDSTMQQQHLTDEKFTTLLAEIEHTINSRPITVNPDSPHDHPPITPNELARHCNPLRHPPGLFNADDIYQKRWRHVLFLAEDFWIRFERSYLPLLHKRSKWNVEKENLKIGEVVLLLGEPTSYRNNYPLAIITQVYPDKDDGLVRSVQLRCRGKLLRRPITKVCRLEGVVTNDD